MNKSTKCICIKAYRPKYSPTQCRAIAAYALHTSYTDASERFGLPTSTVAAFVMVVRDIV